MGNYNILKAIKEAGFDLEIAEVGRKFYDYTGFPKSQKKYTLVFKADNYSIEEMYFWMVGHLTNDWGLPYAHKITDIFAASQTSSMFGDMHSRLTAIQNQASQLLATISNMTKDLFKRVRELREIRERLAYYVKADASNKKKQNDNSAIGAENTLKDIWITMVEGGGENPSSVYGMARKVEFTILPDLFFQTPVLTREEVHDYVKILDFNKAVKIALERKLYQFLIWKKRTWEELQFKEKFQKKLIYQHYANIRQYLEWIKPYLKNIKKLSMNGDLQDSQLIIGSIESGAVEFEVMLYMPIGTVKAPHLEINEKDSEKEKQRKENELKKLKYNAVVLLHIQFQSSPKMNYHSKDSWHQKGPEHIGRAQADIRAYGWSDKQIENYLKLKADEEIELLQAINYTLKDEGDLLGQDLKQILDEVRKDMGKKTKTENKEDEDKPEEKNVLSVVDPFTSVGKGLKELFYDPFAVNKATKKTPELKGNKKFAFDNHKFKLSKEAEGKAKLFAWQVYKNYKKAHRMVTW